MLKNILRLGKEISAVCALELGWYHDSSSLIGSELFYSPDPSITEGLKTNRNSDASI